MSTDSRPNVLVIHADQHRFDCLGCYGNPDLKTPNIDALAADGIRYNQSFCTLPICTPSRYSLLCGLHVHQHLGWTNRCTLSPGIQTFPRLLRDAGYRTHAVGKMHFTPTYLDVGFETMQLAEQDGDGRWDDDYHRHLQERGLIDGIDITDQRWEFRRHADQEYWEGFGAGESDLPEEHHSTTWIGDRAIEAIDGWEGGGNLLMAGFIKPHHPFDPPAPWSRMYDPDTLSILPGWTEEVPEQDRFTPGYFPNRDLTEAQLRRIMGMYYATISQIDAQIGRMIDLLKGKQLYDNTLIVYTSDHGDYQGFHHLVLKGNNLYDPVVKVPLILKLPGQTRAGEVSEQLVSNIDLAPTVAKACGCKPDQWMGGLDLADPEAKRQFVFTEYARCMYMIRSNRFKLIWAEDQQRRMLFDLERDPFELNNLIDDDEMSEVIVEHLGALNRWLAFESVSPVNVDRQARLCGGDNVQAEDGPHRDAIRRYSHEQLGVPLSE